MRNGTYRFSLESDNNRVLGAYNTTASTVWWRIMTIYGTSDDIGIIDPSGTVVQNWILTKV
jgi:hypothetical protein